MAIPEQQLGDLSFRGVMLLGAYGAEDLMVTSDDESVGWRIARNR